VFYASGYRGGGEDYWDFASVVATALTDVGFCLLVWVLLTRREVFD